MLYPAHIEKRIEPAFNSAPVVATPAPHAAREYLQLAASVAGNMLAGSLLLGSLLMAPLWLQSLLLPLL